MGSKNGEGIARDTTKRNGFEAKIYKGGPHIVLTNKKESFSPGRRGQNENERKQEQPKEPPHAAMGEGRWVAMGVAPVWKLCLKHTDSPILETLPLGPWALGAWALVAMGHHHRTNKQKGTGKHSSYLIKVTPGRERPLIIFEQCIKRLAS